jgi:hypothetical protein
MGDRTDAFSILVGISEETDHLEQPGVDGRTDIEEVDLGRHLTKLIRLRIGTGSGLF